MHRMAIFFLLISERLPGVALGGYRPALGIPVPFFGKATTTARQFGRKSNMEKLKMF
jgi:hypothetical protein